MERSVADDAATFEPGNPATLRPTRWAVIRALGRLSATQELQYPANFLASLIGTVFWLSMAILTVALFYSHTTHLGGWSFWETVALLGVFNALVGVIEGVLRPGIGSLADQIRHGAFDLVLTRPVDAQLYLTFRQLDLLRIADVLLGFALSSVALHRLGRSISAAHVLAFAVTFASAVAVLYSVWVILMCLAFWFVAIENLPTVFDALFEAARYPASALVGRLSPLAVLESIAVGATALLVSRAVWRIALRRYTSAGG